MTTSPTVNIKEAAELLCVHPKTVLDFINSGALPAAKVGRAYVLMTRDVVNYVENQILVQTRARMSSTTTGRISSIHAGSHSA
jgi:excisionase family DNA binding protein